MVCSEQEVGKGSESEGIWVLPEDTTIKDKVEDMWGERDYVFDIDLTSNRVDCQSMVGVAKDLAAYYLGMGAELKHPVTLKKGAPFLNEWVDQKDLSSEGLLKKQFDGLDSLIGNFEREKLKKGQKVNLDKSLTLDVEVDEVVDSYLVRVISGLKVKESPRWLREQLHFLGMRPINNIVDVTNLMMLVFGQPMHAFDLKHVEKKEIIVDAAKKGEAFVDLGGQTHKLEGLDLVIRDSAKVLGLAGIIGGENSSIGDDTTEIVLEAASFPKSNISATRKRLQLDTSSSIYFERGVFPEGSSFCLDRATELLIALAGEEKTMVGPSCGKKYHAKEQKQISLRYEKVYEMLGCPIDTKKTQNFFTVLGLDTIRTDSEKIVLGIPFFRDDLNEECDLVEEVGRLYGYNRIEGVIPATRHDDHKIALYLERDAKRVASKLGYDEVLSFPLIEEKIVKNTTIDLDKVVRVTNPMHSDYSHMRCDFLTGMLKVVKHNMDHHGINHFRLFEAGHIFKVVEPSQKESFGEKESVGFLLAVEEAKDYGDGQHPFYEMKFDIFAFLREYKLDDRKLKLVQKQFYYSHPVASASIEVGERLVGTLGVVSKSFLKFFGVSGLHIIYGEVDLQELQKVEKKPIKYSGLFVYPSVSRDLAIVVDKNQPLGDLILDIENSSKLVEKVHLSDVYRGMGIAIGKKSFLFKISLRSQKETLKSSNADNIIEKIVRQLKKKYSFELR